MGRTVSRAGVRFAFESSNGDIGLQLTLTPMRRLRSEDWKERMTSVLWLLILTPSTTVQLLPFARELVMTYWVTMSLQLVIW